MAKDQKNNDTEDVSFENKPKFSIDAIKTFSSDVQSEFNKIAWPDKKHTIASTGVVVVLVMVISFYLATVDLVLGKLIGFVLR